MEEVSEEDIKLVTDFKELKVVIASLQRDILQLEALHREEKKELLKKRQKAINSNRSLVLEKGDKPADTTKADDPLLVNLKTMKSRFLAESKVMQEIKPTVSKNTTIVNLNLEKELKETSENLKTLIEIAEEQGAELRTTLERLDVSIDRDRKIADALQAKLDEKMQKLATDTGERNVHRIRVLKSNVRNVKRNTTELWDKLAEFLHVYFPSVLRNENEQDSMTNEQNISVADGQSHHYVQLSEMIQQLMNAYMSKTDDSYLKISKRWYPGYVKMLLGRGICVQHPQRPDRIRLETYL